MSFSGHLFPKLTDRGIHPVNSYYADDVAAFNRLCELVVEMMAAGTPVGDIFVYTSCVTKAHELEQIFSARHISTFLDLSHFFPTTTFSKKLLLIGKFLTANSEAGNASDHLLLEMMHMDFYKIPYAEVAAIAVGFHKRKNGQSAHSLKNYLREKCRESCNTLFEPVLHPCLVDFDNELNGLIKMCSDKPLSAVFKILLASPSIKNYLEQSTNPLELQAVAADLAFLVDWYENSQESHQNSDFFSWLSHQQALHEKSPNKDQRIRILLLNTVDEKIFLNDESAHETIDSFVALLESLETKKLQIAFSKDTPVAFLTEHPAPNRKAFIAKESKAYKTLQERPQVQKLPPNIVSGFLSRFVMNVTALNNYLDCPLAFYFKNILRFPAASMTPLIFGSAIHYALQCLFESMQRNPARQFPSVAATVNFFSGFMKQHRNYFSEENFNQRLQYGENILASYYDFYIPQCNKIVAVERSIQVMLDEIPLKGKIDKLEFSGKQVHIVDYKTGNVNNIFHQVKLLPPHERQPDGGDYWRQAVFYKILVDQADGKNWRAVSAAFDFIEPCPEKGYQQMRVQLTDADTTTVKQQIVNAWKRIQAEDFYTGCGQKDCRWCNLVKNNMPMAI
jgi:DNA helicase II / ATP-dependent DNA helicase PcrA